MDDWLDRGSRDGRCSEQMKRRESDDVQTALADVRAVYAQLEQRPIERNCVRLKECCQFKLTGRKPYLTKGEALVAAKALRATGRKGLPEVSDGGCPLLDRGTGNCLIYRDRPFGCRTHFCAAAGGPYTRREVSDLIQRLETIDANLGGTGASGLPHAVAAAHLHHLAVHIRAAIGVIAVFVEELVVDIDELRAAFDKLSTDPAFEEEYERATGEKPEIVGAKQLEPLLERFKTTPADIKAVFSRMIQE